MDMNIYTFKKNLSVLIFAFLFLNSTIIAQQPLIGDELNSFYTSFSIEEGQQNEVALIAYIELNNGSYVISPFSKDTIYGHVNLSLKESELITLVGAVSESPISKEEYDPILETQVKFVRTNTRYKQEIKLETKNDFELGGAFWFLLEPECVPYKIDFLLKQKSGRLSVEKMNTATDY